MKPHAILIACGLLGCQSQPEAPTPAVIEGDPSNAVIEITAAISSTLGTNITLSADAFSASSLVTLEHRTRQTIEGRPATGLVTDKPEQFKLVRTHSGCAILRLKTGERIALRDTRCRAEPVD